jgi:hypothetical protein
MTDTTMELYPKKNPREITWAESWRRVRSDERQWVGDRSKVDPDEGEGDGGHAHLDVPHPDRGARVLQNPLEVDPWERDREDSPV